MQLPNLSEAIALLKNEFLPAMCSCPKNSSREAGLIRSASGANFFDSSENKFVSSKME